MNLFTIKKRVKFNMPNESKIEKKVKKINSINSIKAIKKIKKFYYYINKKIDYFSYIIFCI